MINVLSNFLGERFNILLGFLAERLNVYLNIACIAILVLGIIALFIKMKLAYPISVGNVISPSLLLAFVLFAGNWFNPLTFAIFAILTVLWILLLVFLNLEQNQ